MSSGELPYVRPSLMGWIKLLLIALATALAALATYAYNEKRLDDEQRHAAIALTHGDPDKAPALMRQYGCAGCHTIPAVPGAAGNTGPALDNVARQVYIAGVLTNSPDNLIRWIVDPQGADPRTAMPRTGISEEEARHVAAYLYALR